MIKTTIGLLVGASLALLGPHVVHARGFGGCRGGGEYHGESRSGGEYHGDSYSGSHSYSAASDGRYGAASGSYNRSYDGSHGGSADVSGTRGAAYGPNGAAAGSTRDVSATGPQGHTYNSQQERGAAAGPYGATAAYHGAMAYNTGHTALPTDAGFGLPAARTGSTAYAGYHQTEAVSGSVYAARGAAVRTAYGGSGIYGRSWYAAHPGAWSPSGWTAGQAWSTATWPAAGTSLSLGAAVQPFAYNYGTDITYQGDQVYYGGQPAGTAEQYYQEASTLAQSGAAPDPQSGDWLPLGVFALVRKDESDPHYVIQLAVNKSGAVGGNYTDRISEATLPVQGAVDRKNQRVAWTVGKNKSTVAEAGLYNLTQDEAPALIHIGKDKTQQWMLVRLKQPDQASSEK